MSRTQSFALTPFGELCKQGRVAMGGMTMRELAKHVGASPLVVSQIEQGKIEIPAHYALLVMQILGLDAEDVEAALAQTTPTYQLQRTAPSRYGSQS
jgi:transcriptional regulator with XRE-family HTH domain